MTPDPADMLTRANIESLVAHHEAERDRQDADFASRVELWGAAHDGHKTLTDNCMPIVPDLDDDIECRKPPTVREFMRFIGDACNCGPENQSPVYQVRMSAKPDPLYFDGTFSGYVSRARSIGYPVGAKVPGKFKRRKA